jgi:8-oxo-dGTP diphosphatase
MSRLRSHPVHHKPLQPGTPEHHIQLAMNIDPKTLINDPLFNELVDRAELTELHQEYGHLPVHMATVHVSHGLFQFFRNSVKVKRNRRGEVVLMLENPDHKILVHTKGHYPAGVYRLPTGGIKYHETVFNGFYREIDEETGLLADFVQFIGIIAYVFHWGIHTLPFISYIFKVKVEDNQPQVKDTGENITDFQWIPIADLGTIAHELESIQGSWGEWGAMRAIAHRVIFDTHVMDGTKLE